MSELLGAWSLHLGDEALARGVVGLAVGVVAAWLHGAGPAVGPLGRRATVAACCALAVAACVRWASVVDDAFIAFRYARNLLAGEGLVFNPGERVEGFTDLSWVLLVAAGSRLSGAELPLVALLLDLVVVAALVATTSAAACRLGGDGGFPLAAAIVAAHGAVWAHGTTGLETGLTALLATATLRALGGTGPASAALVGLFGALAVTTRPDAGLAWLAGGIGVALRPGDRGRALGAWAAPALLVVAVEAWRWSYYGDWLPNTAYAKSAGRAYWSQGLVYSLDFWLGSASVLLVPPAVAWAAGLGPGTRATRAFVIGLLVVQGLYVTRLGGDFMSGRFYVLLVPLLAVAAELAWRGLEGTASRAALVGLLALGAGQPSMVPRGRILGWIADEGSLYPVVSWSPVRIGHRSDDVGRMLGRTVTGAGLRPVVASGTIGMLGYHGGTELVDVHGLTDRTVARQGLARRGHIGHEKDADLGYLRARGVTLFQGRSRCLAPVPEVRRLVPPTGADPHKPWCLLRWDAALVAGLRRGGWRVPDPGAAIARMGTISSEDRESLDAFFEGRPWPAPLRRPRAPLR